MLTLTVLLLGLGLLTFSTPMHRHHQWPSFQEAMSSESSDSMESVETGQQVTPTSHVPESDIIIRTPADFGQPNVNGHSAVTVSLRDENTNVSVDILTFIFNTEDEAGKSSAAGESSGFSDEGMMADKPSVTQRDATDEQSYKSDIVKENKKVKDDVPKSINSLNEGSYQTPDLPNFLSTGNKSNGTSKIYLPNQQTIDFNSDESLQSEVNDLSNDIQADEAFVASLDAAKSLEQSSTIALNGERKQGIVHFDPVHSTEHGFSSNSEETAQVESNVSQKLNLHTNVSNTHDSGSDIQPTDLPEGKTLSKSLEDHSNSKELSITFTTVFHYLFGELIGLRSVPAPLKPQSVGELMTSMEEEPTSTEAKMKGTDLRPDINSVHSHKVRIHSGPTSSPWMFQGVSPLFSSEEQEDNDATVSSPVPSPEPLLNPLSAKKDLPKYFASIPGYINDGWPAADYSNSWNDVRYYHKYRYNPEHRNREWEQTEENDNSVNSHNSRIPTDKYKYHETVEQDTAQEITPANSWKAEVQSIPTETHYNLHSEDQSELTSNFAASREDVNFSSSETSRETTVKLLGATDVSPTVAAQVLSNSLESTETMVGPGGKNSALTVSSSKEELDPVSRTDAPDLIFSSLPPMSSEEQVSPASISSRISQTFPGSADKSESNEEDVNANLNQGCSRHPCPLENSRSEDDQNEESFSNEFFTDSPGISVESPLQSTVSHELLLLQYITEHPESVSVSDLIESDEDLSSEISTPNPSTGLEITFQTSAIDAKAHVAKTSEESQESQEPSMSTLIPPEAIDPSQTPHTKKNIEESTTMDYVANYHLHSKPKPTATSPKEEKVNPWASFLQSLKAHMTPWQAKPDDQVAQRPWNKYGNRHHSSHYIHSNKGQKASSSEESK